MAKKFDVLNVELDTGGTGAISFRATGVQEYWLVQGEEELDTGKSEKPFSRDEFEQALKKVSRKVKK